MSDSNLLVAQLLLLVLVVMFGLISIQPEYLWSKWPNVCMWTAAGLSWVCMIFILIN